VKSVFSNSNFERRKKLFFKNPKIFKKIVKATTVRKESFKAMYHFKWFAECYSIIALLKIIQFWNS
jgi:hypothetical protein